MKDISHLGVTNLDAFQNARQHEQVVSPPVEKMIHTKVCM